MNLVLNVVGVALLYVAAVISDNGDTTAILAMIPGLAGGCLYGATVMNLYLASRKDGVR